MMLTGKFEHCSEVWWVKVRHYEVQKVKLSLCMARKHLKEWWYSSARFKLGARWSLLDIFMLWTFCLQENTGPFLINWNVVHETYKYSCFKVSCSCQELNSVYPLLSSSLFSVDQVLVDRIQSAVQRKPQKWVCSYSGTRTFLW
jgi:hypothetical protein